MHARPSAVPNKVIPPQRQKGQIRQSELRRCKKSCLKDSAECAGHGSLGTQGRGPRRLDFGGCPRRSIRLGLPMSAHARPPKLHQTQQHASSTAKPRTWLTSRRIPPRARWHEAFRPRSSGPSWAAYTMPCPSSNARCGEHPHVPVRARAVRRNTQRADA